VAAARLVEESGLPWTVRRATQFHDLLAGLFGALARSPIVPVLSSTSFQPIDVRDVAERLLQLADNGAAGRVPDLGGPEVGAMADLARTWLSSTGKRRSVLPVRMPGSLGPVGFVTAPTSPRSTPPAASRSRNTWPAAPCRRRSRRPRHEQPEGLPIGGRDLADDRYGAAGWGSSLRWWH
jgi:uncharacterized protein YbjT (DUF2867 family)